MKRISVNDMVNAALLCGLAIVFQILPLFLSEIFALLTLGSLITLYFITKRAASLGLISIFVIFFIVCMFTVHEGLFFLFTNAVAGFVLGFCGNKGLRFLPSWGLLTLSLTVSLTLLFKVVGLNAVVFMPSSEGLYYLLLLGVCAVLSLILYFVIGAADRVFAKPKPLGKG